MATRWRRNAVVATMAVLVCAAVALNWKYSGEQAVEETGTKILGEATLVSGQETDEAQETLEEADVYGGDDYFASARLTRQQARDSALTLLQEAAAGEDADQTMKDQANDTIQAMADYTVTEAQIENLVVAKGYTDCVAFIGDESVSLAVAAPEGGITEADTARIVDIVTEVAGFTASQIKIIEVE